MDFWDLFEKYYPLKIYPSRFRILGSFPQDPAFRTHRADDENFSGPPFVVVEVDFDVHVFHITDVSCRTLARCRVQVQLEGTSTHETGVPGKKSRFKMI